MASREKVRIAPLELAATARDAEVEAVTALNEVDAAVGGIQNEERGAKDGWGAIGVREGVGGVGSEDGSSQVVW